MLHRPGAMLLGQAPDAGGFEEPPLERPRPQHELLHERPERAAEPSAHGNREAHLRSREDFTRHQVLQRGPQHGLGAPAAQLETARDRRRVFDELVVEVRDPAFDRGRHAHLILFHQQLDQIRLEVGVAHPFEGTAGGLLVAAQPLAVGVATGEQPVVRQEARLEDHGEHGEVFVEQRAGPWLECQNRAPGIAAHRVGETPREPTDLAANSPRGQSPVDAPKPLVPGRHAVAVVAEEELIGALTREHHLDVLPGQARDEVERDARGEGDGLVLVPDQLRQGIEELGGRHDDLAVLRACRAGRKPGVGKFVGLGLREAHCECANRLRDQRRHEGGQAARINPAGQEQPEWHAAHEVAPHGGGEPRA